MTPLDKDCPHIEGEFHCGAEPGMWCKRFDGTDLTGFHKERIALIGRPQVIHDLEKLNPGQVAVLAHIVDGKKVEAIAESLNVTTRIVWRRIEAINRKLKLGTNRDLVAWFYQTYYAPNSIS